MWVYNNKPFTENIENKYGFIYLITYKDGKKYIGKKPMTSYKTLPALKTGIVRDGAVRVNKNVKGKRVAYDILYYESNWKKYNGSSKVGNVKNIASKEILCFEDDAINLTYAEVKHQVINNVLVDECYINANILGKFYRGRIV